MAAMMNVQIRSPGLSGGLRYPKRSRRCLCSKNESIHVLGVNGAGMLPVTLVALAQGYDVRGSDDDDAKSTATTDIQHLGLKLLHGRLQVSDLPDVLVASSALNPTHPDLEMARRHSVPVLSRRQWFRRSLRKFCQVTVSGTHGKTTTASMIAYVLHEMGLQHKYSQSLNFIVGGDIPQLPLSSIALVGSNTRDLLVVEADEYGQAFLGLSPMVAVLTNIGYDHVDQFRMQRGGVLVANGDDQGCRRVVKQAAASEDIVTWQQFMGMGSHEQAKSKVVLFYGFDRDNDITLHASDASWEGQEHAGSIDGASWHSIIRMLWAVPEIRHEEAFMGHDQAFASHFTYHLQLLGDHNASNAAGAVLASAISDAMFRHSFSTACEALSLGMAEVFRSLNLVTNHIHSFTGTKRRLEVLKSTTAVVAPAGDGRVQKSITVYDDYAHHPTECRASLQALKEALPCAQLWIVWEPITRSRLEYFLEDFVEVFASAGPEAIIVGPVDVSREKDDPGKDQQLFIGLEERLNAALPKNVALLNDCAIIIADLWFDVNDQLLSLLAKELSSDCESNIVVIFMGANKVTQAAQAFADCEQISVLEQQSSL